MGAERIVGVPKILPDRKFPPRPILNSCGHVNAVYSNPVNPNRFPASSQPGGSSCGRGARLLRVIAAHAARQGREGSVAGKDDNVDKTSPGLLFTPLGGDGR